MKAKALYAGCFGKLPCAGDFIAQNAGSHQAGAFQRWLLDGVTLSRERLEEEWAGHFLQGGVLRFLWWTDRPESLLFGTLVPGRDESGRRFPFSIFVETALEEMEPVEELPGVFHDPLTAMAGLAARTARGEEGERIGSMGDLKHSMDGFWSRVSAPDGGVPTREATTLDGLGVRDLEAALPGEAASGTVLRAAGNLLELMHRLSGRPAGPLDFALRFPLPASGELVGRASRFWIALALAALGRGRPLPNVYWTAESPHREGHLDLWFGTPDPVAVLFLVHPGLEADRVYPLHEAEAAQVHPDSAAPRARLAEALGGGDTTLAEVLSVLRNAVG